MVVSAARSQQMSLIRSRDTKPELRVRKYLHAAGLRYRLHARELPGTPDLVFPCRRAVVFVHGCFWHKHPGCRAARLPKSRLAFWGPKLDSNAARDQVVQEQLQELGWSVFVIWECESSKEHNLSMLADQLKNLPTRPRRSGNGAALRAPARDHLRQ
ncbi:very short patch repair endonuclease [Burkholderia ambifaria]|uniref:very short patch repair endonuclease n=1 Tax=Burkholderia ambifaria TaxID=152480 RepID=UPI0009DABB2E|nr:very short patch repair endonuclease [Burkholderia ambifaria]